MTSALAQAHRQIVSFTVGDEEDRLSAGLPPTLFDLSRLTAPQKKNHSSMAVTAFSELESFGLHRLASHSKEGDEGESTPGIFSSIDGLPLLLGSLKHLKRLELNLSYYLQEPPVFYSDDQALPKGMVWEHLQSLTLINLSITAKRLLLLVLDQTPNILHIKIGHINLLEGSWEAFFEALAQSKQPCALEFEFDTYLFHHNGQNFWMSDYRKDLENYIVNGGCHPCLYDHQPDSAAQGWLQEFDPIVQKRIAQFGNLNSGLDI